MTGDEVADQTSLIESMKRARNRTGPSEAPLLIDIKEDRWLSIQQLFIATGRDVKKRVAKRIEDFKRI